jgi:RNA polymerase sigma-70 factor (ECF subfamily)
MGPRSGDGDRETEAARWLDGFHAGARDVLEGCYRDHFRTVDQSVGQVLRGADRETVVQDVFLQLCEDRELRRNFSGGFFAAWIATLARSRAVDFWRKHRRERPLDEAPPEPASPEPSNRMEARVMVGQFAREALPPKWAGVFQARFLDGLDQRTAAQRLGISRTTLAYQELQIRRRLKRFLLRREGK